MSAPTPENPAKKNRIIIVALALLFFGPLAIAPFVVDYIEKTRPTETKNTGVLVDPAVPLKEFTLQGLEGQAYGLEQMRGKWSVVYFASGCDARCAETLYNIRQSRLAQGKEYHRVQLLHIPVGGTVSAPLQDLLPEHPKLTVLTGRPRDVQNMWRQFAAVDPIAESERSGVYIVDPLGNLMMSYPGDFTPRQLIKDLQRLLYVSQIG